MEPVNSTGAFIPQFYVTPLSVLKALQEHHMRSKKQLIGGQLLSVWLQISPIILTFRKEKHLKEGKSRFKNPSCSNDDFQHVFTVLFILLTPALEQKPMAAPVHCCETVWKDVSQENRAAACQWNKRRFTEQREPFFFSLSLCHTVLQRVGPLRQPFPYIEPRRCCTGWERCRSAGATEPEPRRTESLSCQWRLHAVPTIPHITACSNKTHQSGSHAECMCSSHSSRAALIALVAGGGKKKLKWGQNS